MKPMKPQDKLDCMVLALAWLVLFILAWRDILEAAK